MRRLIPFFVLLSYCVTAQDSVVKRAYQTNNILTSSIDIDGQLQDEIWNSVEWQSDFIVQRPDNGAIPVRQTKFKILYDNKFIYVGIKSLHENPEKVEKRLSRRDDIQGDFVEINIDSYYDKRTAFSFGVSAAGVKGDWFVTNDGNNWDQNWNPIWFVATGIEKDGWIAEIKIPLSQLRFGLKDDHIWGMNIRRFDFSKSESSRWQHIPQNVSGFTSQMGTLEGIKNIKPKRQLEIQPYVVGAASSSPSESGNPYADGSDYKMNIGVDGKIGVTSNMTLDFTVNPDFGQVEADPSRLTLDGYQIFFGERRPFFVENSNLFSFRIAPLEAGGPFGNDNLFYSRRIGASPRGNVNSPDGSYTNYPQFTSILGAAKFSGKTKKGLSVGILEGITAEEKALISHNGEESTQIVEPLTNYMVGSIRQDFNEGRSFIGLSNTALNRSLDGTGLVDQYHKSAYTGGLDIFHSWKNREYRLKGKLIYSNVNGTAAKITNTQESFEHYFQRPDADHLSVDNEKTNLFGHGGTLSLANYGGKDNISFESGLTWRSPNIDLNDLGFLNTADQIDHVTWVGYRAPKPFWILNQFRVNVNEYLRWSYGGEHLRSAYNTNWHLTFKNFWNIHFGSTYTHKDISAKALFGGPKLRQNRGAFNWFLINSDSRKKLNFGTWIGGFNAMGKDKGAFSSKNIEVRVNYQPTTALSISFRPELSFQNYNIQNVSSADFQGDTRYIAGSIDRKTLYLSTRINYSLSSNLTFQFWGQPFVSKGNYSNYKYITDPLAKANIDRFALYDPNQISASDGGDEFLIDDDRDGTTDYSFSNPDFNFLQFRSNLVLRWEYKPGSEFFLVWTQSNSNDGNPETPILRSLKDDLFGQQANNTFLMKLTYRFY